ncbi:uncharacterized protein [Physcomitrium patens]|uniref:uncharacterized protein isoform X2 n=1 Tax=Physcomitrium patens TaxID=3218 RepID=UPI003CCDE27F
MLFAAGQRGSLNAVTSSAITPGGNPAMDWVGIEEPPCWNVDKRCEGLDEASLFGDRTTLDVTMTGTFHVLGCESKCKTDSPLWWKFATCWIQN